MRILIITIPHAGNIYLANKVSQAHDVVGLVKIKENLKTRQEKLHHWKKTIKRHGILRALNKYAYLKYGANPREVMEVEKMFFYPEKRRIEYEIQTDEINTTDVNSDQVAKFINDKEPDLIAVCGSGVIKQKIFSIPPKGTINIHCGITPQYRSAHPVEWAVYNHDFSNVGVTIHFVNEGIDTGDIIYQQRIKIERHDLIPSIYCRNILAGSELMLRALEDIEKGTVRTEKPDLATGKKYLSIDFGAIQYRRVKKILAGKG